MSGSSVSNWIDTFYIARRDQGRAVLEGFHPVKHALRFGATMEFIVSDDVTRLRETCRILAPDIEEPMLAQVKEIDGDVFKQLAPVPSEFGVAAIARRPAIQAMDLVQTSREAPLIVLENPSHMGNIGAVIRVAAGVGAAGVLTMGAHSPWHPAAIRGAAGLQFALPVAYTGGGEGAVTELFGQTNRGVGGEVIGVHPEGEVLSGKSIDSDAILVFGSESRGLSQQMLERVDRRISIPMQPGVSSLNLATAVAVTLYAWKLGFG